MKLFSALMLALLLGGVCFAGCKSKQSSADSADSGCGGGKETAADSSKEEPTENPAEKPTEEPKAEPVDQAAAMVKLFTDGTINASPWIALHSVVSVGQIWHVESDFGAGKYTDMWQVVKKTGRSTVIVEHCNGQGVVLAYEVDAWAEAGKPNVSRAWVGKKGDEPKEIKLAEWKEGTGAGGQAAGITVREDFGGVEMAGKTFHGELTIIKDSGNTTKIWVAKNGWFNNLIRMDMSDKTMMKVVKAHFDEKVDTYLKWPK